MKISYATRHYRKQNKLTLEAFGIALAEKFQEYTFTRQAVHNWENGSQPDRNFLLLCALRYSDWRRDWALDCLAAINPDLFAPVMSAAQTD